MMVTMAVMSIVMVGIFQVFQEGMQLFRTHGRAADAQQSAIRVLGVISAELVKNMLNSDQFAFWLPAYPKSQLGSNMGSNWSIFGHLRLELVKINPYSDQFALPQGTALGSRTGRF